MTETKKYVVLIMNGDGSIREEHSIAESADAGRIAAAHAVPYGRVLLVDSEALKRARANADSAHPLRIVPLGIEVTTLGHFTATGLFRHAVGKVDEHL